MEFTIHYVTQDTSHNPTNETFIVGITDQSGTEFPSDVEPGSLYDSITPLLVVYTYDNTSIRSFIGERKEQKVPNVHDNTPHPDQKREAPLQDPDQECQRHRIFITYDQLGWSEYVIEPAGGFHFAYCDGQCSVPSDNANTQRGNQAPFPDPCCAPIAITPINIILAQEGMITLVVIDDLRVAQCGGV